MIKLRSEESVRISKMQTGGKRITDRGKSCAKILLEGAWRVGDQCEECGTNETEEGDQSQTVLGLTEQVENWGLYPKNH